jgi:predicted O-methyltransferase YrrM
VLVDIIPYVPQFYVDMQNLAKVGTAWNGVDRVLHDIVNRFRIPQNCALEFGVQGGYSTSALANVFKKVIGVDTFVGDEHAGYHADDLLTVAETLRQWPNIYLIQARYQDYIRLKFPGPVDHYDLIHVDIVHTYEDTYQAGYWSCNHADVVIFHDTEAFPEVMYAVTELAKDTGRKFYNYGKCENSQHGLGILVK